MRHPKLLRSARARFAMIPAAFLCVTVSACADQEPIGPELFRVAPSQTAAFGQFFVAWSQNHSASPIQTQTFSLDARQERQWAWYVNEEVVRFARANPGRLYIVGDEPDQDCMKPSDYAVIYHDFVTGIRNTDPTARVSPAGFAEPNYKCCPLPDDVPAACWSEKHSIGYADQFYHSYIQRYGVPPQVNEWRFHDFGLRSPLGDLDHWWARIDKEAAWSVAHGANMVLGAWGLLAWREPAEAYQEHLKQAMARIMNDSRINGAVYWSHESWAGEHHYLMNADGTLTLEGQTYANPLTDIPANVATESSADGRAMVKWTNTTSAWAAETEFWVKNPGSDSFVYSKTELVPILGARETPSITFAGGTSVKGRVRYYNRYGQAGWSAFSEPTVIPSAPAEVTKKSGSRKTPRFCFLPAGSC